MNTKYFSVLAKVLVIAIVGISVFFSYPADAQKRSVVSNASKIAEPEIPPYVFQNTKPQVKQMPSLALSSEKLAERPSTQGKIIRVSGIGPQPSVTLLAKQPQTNKKVAMPTKANQHKRPYTVSKKRAARPVVRHRHR